MLDFSNFKFLTVGRLKRAELRRYAKFGQNRSKRGRDMAIFQFYKMAAAAILDFLNFKFLTVGRLNRAELRRHAKFGRNPSNRGQNMAIFRFFKMAAAAILDFSNFKFLTVGTLKRAELRRRAKFGRNRSKRGRDMAIFQDGGRPPSWICYVCVRTTHEGYFVVFIAVQNLVGIDTVVSIICMFFDFTSLA